MTNYFILCTKQTGPKTLKTDLSHGFKSHTEVCDMRHSLLVEGEWDDVIILEREVQG